jgi:hypothetical protein
LHESQIYVYVSTNIVLLTDLLLCGCPDHSHHLSWRHRGSAVPQQPDWWDLIAFIWQ